MQYLRKVFAHTIGKTFENYVINQIWARVESFGLFPITQQYVKRPTGYALIDLYFPQINFAIEVDEIPYHDNNITQDKMRMEDIFGAIPDMDLVRIREENYNTVKFQIENISRQIESKVNQLGPFKWQENWQEIDYKEKLERIKNSKTLSTSESIGFKKIQITNDVFGMNLSEGYLQYGKSRFVISENEWLWFPHLTPNKDWKNSISDDWKIIYEEYLGDNYKKKEHDPTGIHNKNRKRYTFAKYKNVLGEISYRFIGVFRFKELNQSVFIYEKVSDEICL
jgi:hypothetical protein